MRITIHQPEHIPWLGFFHKIFLADILVVLDNVQFRRRYFQNRNKIRTASGWQWITVPIEKEMRDALLIKDALVFNENLRWRKKNLESIYLNYNKAPYFNQCWNQFKEIYEHNYVHLSDMNIALIIFFLETLGIKKKICFASTLNISGTKGDLILNICRKINAKTYISGISGKEYLIKEEFERNNINLVFQEFRHPIYRQLYEPFLPCMSVIDILFNYGRKSLDIINGIGVDVMDEVFL